MSFAYRWLRCPTSGGVSDGSNCAPIGGSAGAGSTYRLRDADAGIRIRVRRQPRTLTALTRPCPTRRRSSRDPPPRETSSHRLFPARRSLARHRRRTPEVWSGTQPISFTYQWRSCNGSGGGCSAITGFDGADLRGPAGGRRQDAARTRDGNPTRSTLRRWPRPRRLSSPKSRSQAARVAVGRSASASSHRRHVCWSTASRCRRIRSRSRRAVLPSAST